VTERVVLKGDACSYEGWALNVSRGGVRAILEDQVDLGEEFEVTIGDSAPLVRQARVVWVQEEKDGVVVGLEFLSLSVTDRAASPLPPPNEEP
jgi:hypothetical protein